MTQEHARQDLELHMARQEAGQSPFNQTIENLLYWSIIDMGNVWAADIMYRWTTIGFQ